MKTWVVAVGLVVGLIAATALAKAEENWNRGQLVLANQTVLEGDLNYNWKAEVVRLKQADGRIRAFSAQQIRSFRFYDYRNRLLRRFASLDFTVRRNMPRKMILEEFVQGKYPVYRRLRHQREPIRIARPIEYSNDTELLKDDNSFTYFVLADGEFQSLDAFQRTMMPQMMSEYGDDLRNYLRTHQLDPRNTTTRLMLLVRYNALEEGFRHRSPATQGAVSGEE